MWNTKVHIPSPHSHRSLFMPLYWNSLSQTQIFQSCFFFFWLLFNQLSYSLIFMSTYIFFLLTKVDNKMYSLQLCLWWGCHHHCISGPTLNEAEVQHHTIFSLQSCTELDHSLSKLNFFLLQLIVSRHELQTRQWCISVKWLGSLGDLFGHMHNPSQPNPRWTAFILL